MANISTSQLKNREDILNISCGFADTKHKLNLSNREVPQKALDAIESGCPIETLEKLAKDFPICKYKTQITIHGIFPKISTNYIGTYHNLVQNKNKSIGVRWTAIDCEKKNRLFKEARKLCGYSVISNSSTYHLQKVKSVNKDTIKDVLESFKAEANRLDKSLFSGSADVWTGSLFGSVFVVFELHINSFYEKDYEALAFNLTGMTAEERKAKIEAMEAQYKADMEKWQAERKAQAEADAKRKAEELAKFSEANPCPFPKVEGYTMSVGDMIAYPDRQGYPAVIVGWKFYRVAKRYGKIVLMPCAEDGTALVNKYGEKCKGLQPYKTTGDFYVKRVA